jgi:hypothetical protein
LVLKEMEVVREYLLIVIEVKKVIINISGNPFESSGIFIAERIVSRG